ncbi:MAG: PHP domain-containing protein [Bacillota bacterium]|nr:PHP domain-containing protein [Bacillota bacterium]
MKYRIDTHMHTTASDGTLNPQELLNEINKKNIKVFSITDHDTIANIDEMIELTKDSDVIFIPGVELSVTYMGKEIHLLTYSSKINSKNEGIMKVINENRILRGQFEDKYMAFVSNKFKFELEEYKSYKRDPKEGGWKAFSYLKEKGIVSTIQEIIALIRESGIPFLFKQPKEILPTLKELGLLVVLAHPPAYFKGEQLSKDFLDYFKLLGIDGIECYSPYYNDQSEALYYTEYCKENGLLIMSGSDYHGSFTPSRKLGVPERSISEKSLQKLLAMIK